VIATKAGLTRQAPGVWAPVGRPEYLRQKSGSACALGVERIDLLQLQSHRSKCPVAESLAPLSALQKEGKIAHIGLSEVDVKQFEERELATIVSVQNLFNLTNRSAEPARSCDAPLASRYSLVSLATGALAKPAAPLQMLAEEASRQPLTIGLAWLLKRRKSCCDPGYLHREAPRENVAGAELELSDANSRLSQRALAAPLAPRRARRWLRRTWGRDVSDVGIDVTSRSASGKPIDSAS